MAYTKFNPLRFTDKQIIGCGSNSIVFTADVVFKSPLEDDHQSQNVAEREREIYRHLGPFPGILKYYGVIDGYTVLGRVKYGSIREVLQNETFQKAELHRPRRVFDVQTRIRWIKEIIQTFIFIHSRKVLHGDVSCYNIFLDEGWKTLVGDFAGSGIDGKEALICYSSAHSLPGTGDASVTADIFALGSTFFEILSGLPPFHKKERDFIEKEFAGGRFPDTSTLPVCQEIINNCWQQRYDNVTQLLNDLIEEGKNPREPFHSLVRVLTKAVGRAAVLSTAMDLHRNSNCSIATLKRFSPGLHLACSLYSDCRHYKTSPTA